MAGTTIAVIGAGFSGTLLALHLLRRCPPSTRILLIERNRRFGHGTAYGTSNPVHLLNVPAGRMSAFHDQPSHFLDWLRNHPDAQRDPSCRSGDVHPGSFVPRRQFGAYVRSLLKQELRRDPRRQLELLSGEVLAASDESDGLVLVLDRGRTVVADLAVLAIGNFPPEPMRVDDPSFYLSPLYRPDPWAPEALAGLHPDAGVLLIGTGLTSVDMAISLLDAGHRGPIHALSRRGLLPRPHLPAPAQIRPVEAGSISARPLALLRFLRAAARAAEASDGSWHAVVDGLRPISQDLWQAMPLEERRRFLRHLRPWWDVHRHRMAPSVAARIAEASLSRQFQVHAGRIRAFGMQGETVDVIYRPKRSNNLAALTVGRVINCTGLGADYDRIADPLVRFLLDGGLARPDPLRLGLDITPAGALLRRDGSISRRLFAIGPVTKGMFWEIVAVPDIRRQCELMAQHLAAIAAQSANIRYPAIAHAARANAYAI
jgi:uncharacterized NAD(P)/FAD-binding protein YdhS